MPSNFTEFGYMYPTIICTRQISTMESPSSYVTTRQQVSTNRKQADEDDAPAGSYFTVAFHGPLCNVSKVRLK